MSDSNLQAWSHTTYCYSNSRVMVSLVLSSHGSTATLLTLEWKVPSLTSGLTSGPTSGPNQRSPFFADDSKLYRPIDRPIASSSYLLQSDLDCLHKWSHDWAMEFNITTCKVLHISR